MNIEPLPTTDRNWWAELNRRVRQAEWNWRGYCLAQPDREDCE
jgi:hypothetical protein